jgi:hypothetical protein
MHFHKTFNTPEDYRKFLVTDGAMTLGELGKRFKKPDWCAYEDAVKGGKKMGCMSLWNFNIKTIEDCKGCDECND